VTASSATTITSMPVLVDESACWECSCPVPNRQAARTLAAWQAIICPDCAPWVAAHLGPLATTTD